VVTAASAPGTVVTHLTVDFEAALADLRRAVRDVDGFLHDRELAFLLLLGACPTAAGVILEIGSFRGRSTIALARGALLSDRATVVAVDPLIVPAAADGSGDSGAETHVRRNLDRAGVAEAVEFHKACSWDLAPSWDRPLRLLWIDGDHRPESVRRDFEGFSPHLADGGIVAFHDALHAFRGPLEVFCGQVLPSGRFGAAGVCGSIAWAQLAADPRRAARHGAANRRLQRRLARLLPCVADRGGYAGRWARLKYKALRAPLFYRRPNPGRWVRRVTAIESTA